MEILVKFQGSDDWIEYTTAIWNLLITDSDVEHIISKETGEVLYYKIPYKYYIVRYKHLKTDYIYDINIVCTDNKAKIRKHYSAKYEWVDIHDCTDYELKTWQNKGIAVRYL